MNINREELEIAIEAAAVNRENLLIVGMPGNGKTQITKQVVQQITDYQDLWHPAISNPTDFQGFPTIAEGIARFVPFSHLKALVDYQGDEPYVVIIDDLIQASTAVKAALMQVIEERRIGEHIISPNAVFIMLSNDVTHKAGGTGMIEPLKSRATIYHFALTPDEWVQWAHKQHLRSTVPSYIRFRPEALNNFTPSTNFNQSPNPRTWEKLSHRLDALDNLNATTNLRIATAEGLIGSYGAEYIAFETMAAKLPDPKEVLRDPTIFSHDDNDPSITYALTGAVASLATVKNFKQVIKFSKTIPESFGINLISDAISTCPDIVQTQAFGDWSLENADLYGDLMD